MLGATWACFPTGGTAAKMPKVRTPADAFEDDTRLLPVLPRTGPSRSAFGAESAWVERPVLGVARASGKAPGDRL